MKLKPDFEIAISVGVQNILDLAKSGMPDDGIAMLLKRHVIGLLENQQQEWFEDDNAEPVHSEIAIWNAQAIEDARADAAGETPKLIKGMADVPENTPRDRLLIDGFVRTRR